MRFHFPQLLLKRGGGDAHSQAATINYAFIGCPQFAKAAQQNCQWDRDAGGTLFCTGICVFYNVCVCLYVKKEKGHSCKG